MKNPSQKSKSTRPQQGSRLGIEATKQGNRYLGRRNVSGRRITRRQRFRPGIEVSRAEGGFRRRENRTKLQLESKHDTEETLAANATTKNEKNVESTRSNLPPPPKSNPVTAVPKPENRSKCVSPRNSKETKLEKTQPA